MKKLISLFALMLTFAGLAHGQSVSSDSVFHTYIYNDEYKVYLDINLYANDVMVPGQEVFGNVPGYLGATRDSRKWLITSAKLVGKNMARLEITNDYGSEDLTAILEYNPSSKTYTLKQHCGSRLKIVVNRKWLKLPGELELKPSRRVPSAW